MTPTVLTVVDWIVAIGGAVGIVAMLRELSAARRAKAVAEPYVGSTLVVMALLAGPAAARLVNYQTTWSLLFLGVSAGLATLGYGEWRRSRRSKR